MTVAVVPLTDAVTSLPVKLILVTLNALPCNDPSSSILRPSRSLAPAAETDAQLQPPAPFATGTSLFCPESPFDCANNPMYAFASVEIPVYLHHY